MTSIHYSVTKLFSNKMAVTVVLFWVSLVLTVIGSDARGELSVLYHPKSLSFSGSRKALESGLKEIFSASLGLSVDENSEWDGLLITDPFDTPEAAVEVYIEGVSSIGNTPGLKVKKYEVKADELQPSTYKAVKHRIEQRFTNGGNKVVNINLSDPNEIKKLVKTDDVKETKVPKQPLEHLKYNIDEDYQFLSELQNLKTVTEKVKSDIAADNIVDFYRFRLHSLHALSDFHGPNSPQTKEAKALLGKALVELTNAFVKAYDGSVLVAAVASDVAHTRRTVRAADDPEAEQAEDEHNADNYSADYAAIFNIMLWFGVVLTFSLVAIVYALMDMDPGRDSIIYRMTSTRMKKDN